MREKLGGRDGIEPPSNPTLGRASPQPWYNARASFEKLAEIRLKEAMEQGEFANLSKSGQHVKAGSCISSK